MAKFAPNGASVRWFTVLALAALVASGLSMASEYSIVDLGTLGKPTQTRASGLSSDGVVVGSSIPVATGRRGFVWDSVNGMRELPTLGGDYSWAYDVNDSGQMVGDSWLLGWSKGARAFLWDQSNPMEDLGTLGGKFSYGRGINNQGQVVGHSHIGRNLGVRAFLWDETNGLQDLGTLGGRDSWAKDINESGVVAGTSRIANTQRRAALWDETSGWTQIPVTPDTVGAHGMGLNEAEQAVGFLWGEDFTHAFVWDVTSGLTEIGTLGGNVSEGLGINSEGTIVGRSKQADGKYRAFIWDETNGLRNLNDLVDPGSGWTLIRATRINDAGQITGFGIVNGEQHAYLLIPEGNEYGTTPELSTWALLLCSAAAGVMLCRRRRG
ncbi:MAG: DUF3466 family protein [Armatimonadetes bacterium]|nr:DUF3466 family protein [Armatimonadota bacterium]